ncbi:DUF1254 domain-containing protein [Flavobacterium soyae]|uniref:DUF1254 domain-containing protein n=1 Tax=Flavobacterium soyae TaxID=2903098 RepID=A0ABZ2UCI4_9FLAO
MKKSILILVLLSIIGCTNSKKEDNTSNTEPANIKGFGNNSNGWIGTETVRSRLGDFEFKNGYPTSESVKKLNEALVYNRAIEVYLDQIHGVSWYAVWKGVAKAGAGKTNQLVIWETLMDAETLLLTGNSETVYGLASIDLKRDGAVVVEVPAMMLGGFSDIWQSEIANIGPTGMDKGKGGKYILLPPDYKGTIPAGYMVLKSTTYKVVFGVRGFQQDGKTDKAVALMKTAKIYPLSKVSNPPVMEFTNGSGKAINTIFSDNSSFFTDLNEIIQTEPDNKLQTNEKFLLASIGIEKGKPFKLDANRKNLLNDAAQTASALARVKSFASDEPERLVYTDRRWEWAFVGGSATWDSQGYVNTDRRAAFAYIAIGMSPAMVLKIVGGGSQYLCTPRAADGEFLDGSKNYKLHIPSNIPVKNFWSVVAYDSESRSMIRNGRPFPTVSQYTGPKSNSDGSIDVYFGPELPKGQEKNWIKTVKGKGYFVLVRFYGPLDPFFDKTWKLDDIIEMK